jgi:hypothetical protein
LRSFDPTLQTIDSNGVGTVTDFKERWQPPPAGMFKINCDVGFNPKLQFMGVGVIVRDEHGRVHAAQSKTLTSYQEPVVGGISSFTSGGIKPGSRPPRHSP